MGKNRSFWVGIVAAAALAVMGCSDDENGVAGSGGSGGTGGTPATGNVTAVHLAPEVPSELDTAVALFVNGAEQTELGTLEYSQSTGKIALPVGTYESIGVGVPGATDPVVTVGPVDLMEDDDLVVVAYRTGDETLVDLFVFVNSTAELTMGEGRVFVGHGADEPALNPVNVVTTDALEPTACTPLIPGFQFGTIKPDLADGDDPLDLAADSVFVAFDLDDECPPATLGPVEVPVTDDVVSILVAVDEDTADFDGETGLNVELWAIIPDADAPGNQPIRTIQTAQ
jgi:hypothetical protein